MRTMSRIRHLSCTACQDPQTQAWCCNITSCLAPWPNNHQQSVLWCLLDLYPNFTFWCIILWVLQVGMLFASFVGFQFIKVYYQMKTLNGLICCHMLQLLLLQLLYLSLTANNISGTLPSSWSYCQVHRSPLISKFYGQLTLLARYCVCFVLWQGHQNSSLDAEYGKYVARRKSADGDFTRVVEWPHQCKPYQLLQES